MSTSEDTVVAVARRPVEAPALAAVPIGVIALLPWIGDGAMTLARTLTSAALGALAAFLARTVWSRPSRVVLDSRAGTLETPRGRMSLRDVRAIALTERGGVVGQPRAYALELLLRDGSRQLLADADTPDPVVQDLGAVLGVLDLPVEAGWGLPPTATPWRDHPPREVAGAGVPAPPLELLPQHRQEGLELTMRISVPTLAVLAPWLIRDHWSFPWSPIPAPPTHPLSFWLPAALVAAFAVVVALTRRHRVQVSGVDPLLVVRRGNAGPGGTRSVARGELVGAWPVSPDGGEPRHVLVQTTRELFSVPCSPEDAPRLTQRLLGV